MKFFNKKEFIGKTIVDVNDRATNYLEFSFSDGTKTAIETEHVGHGIYGIASVNCEGMPNLNVTQDMLDDDKLKHDV